MKNLCLLELEMTRLIQPQTSRAKLACVKPGLHIAGKTLYAEHFFM